MQQEIINHIRARVEACTRTNIVTYYPGEGIKTILYIFSASQFLEFCWRKCIIYTNGKSDESLIFTEQVIAETNYYPMTIIV